jgi:hypothetical protein
LEDEHQVTGQLVTNRRKAFCDPDAHRHMDIVPTYVTHSWGKRPILHRVWCIGWHRVHVGAERDRRSRLRTTQDPHDALPADARAYFESQCAKPLGDDACGPLLFAGNFRMPMEVVSEFDQGGFRSRQLLGDPIGDRGRFVSLCLGRSNDERQESARDQRAATVAHRYLGVSGSYHLRALAAGGFVSSAAQSR